MKNNFIKRLLRETINKKNNRNEYGCVMLSVDVDKLVWGSIQDIIDDKDVYHGDDVQEGFGRETKPHITILYGLNETVSDNDVRDKLKGIKKFDIKINNISLFKNDKFDVLKFDVTSSELVSLNKSFKELSHVETYKNYHPHMTIAYLKPNIGDKYVDKLKKYVNSVEVTINDVIYSKVSGKEVKIKI